MSDRTPPVFEQISPVAKTYVDGTDFATMSYSGSGDVTAPVFAVDAALDSANSGCESSDFAGFTAGSIALMRRGACTFRIKATNAAAAGAVASIIFNNIPGSLNGTLGEPIFSQPVLGTPEYVGVELANGVANGLTGVTVHVRTDTVAQIVTTRNVFAETDSGDPDRVVVVGAHLDSVSRGPGINDNGSGSAAILEVAEQFAAQDRVSDNKIRFAWWGAEEHGLIGSTRYVQSLSAAERDQILLNLNFDMIGSPNFVRFVYDGDNSAFPVGGGVQDGPDGSGAIEQVFTDYFAAVGSGKRTNTVQRTIGLRTLHRAGDPGRWTVHGCRGDKDRGPGSRLRGHGGATVRPLLPPRV